MSTADIVFAAFLLTAPAGSPEPVATEEHWPALREGLQQLAIQWEILDPRETSYILSKREELASDLALLRRRLQDFRDVPLLADHHRLPDRATANELIRANREYRKRIEERRIIEVDRAHALTTVIRECDELYQVWDAVRDAKCEFYYVTVRRAALKKLRDRLGDASYYAAEFPPALPVWRFAP